MARGPTTWSSVDVSESNGKSADTENPEDARQTAERGPEQAQPAAARPADDETEASGEPSTEQPLAQLEAERDRLKDQLVRTAADFDNFRKRTKRDLEEADRRAREETLREFLPIIDNLERAASAAEDAQDPGAIAEGVQMVLRQFEDVASRLQLERVQSMGQRFDPNVHDAIQQQETDDAPPGTIIAEVTPGYRLGERLLRAAVVVVARPPSGAAQSGAGGGSGESS